MRTIPEDPRPEILHGQLVYVEDGEWLRLRSIPELALRWLEVITEMGGLPEPDQLRRLKTGSRLRRTSEDPINTPPLEDVRSAVLENGQQVLRRG